MSLYPHEKKTPKGPTEPYPVESKSLDIVMREYLRERNLSYTCARHNGWYPTKHIDSVPRVVVPATNLEGSRYWQARAMVHTLDRLRWRSAVGHKAGSIVVVWPYVQGSGVKLIIVEGPFDALAAGTTHHIGLAAMGKINVGDVINYVKKGLRVSSIFAGLPVIVVPDMDAPEFGTQAITELGLAGIKAEIRMPDFEDLAALKPKQRERLLA